MKIFKKKLPNYMLTPVPYEPKDQFIESIVKLKAGWGFIMDEDIEIFKKIIDFIIEREKIYLEKRGTPTCQKQ